MQSEPEPPSEAIPLEATKDELELKKLGLEIVELERPWWKRPAYILAALPTLLAVMALSVGFLNGFFSAQLTKLENQKHDLEAQVKLVGEERTALEAKTKKLADDYLKMNEALVKAQKLQRRNHEQPNPTVAMPRRTLQTQDPLRNASNATLGHYQEKRFLDSLIPTRP